MRDNLIKTFDTNPNTGQAIADLCNKAADAMV